MSQPVEAQKASLKSADTNEKDDTRTTVTGDVEKASTEPPKDVAKPSEPATEEGAGNTGSTGQAEKKSTDSGDNEEGGEKKGDGQSESMVRSSYLPSNKLKDAPPVSNYEGKDPMEFAKGDNIGTGQILKEKVNEMKEKVTSIGKKKDDK